MRILRLSLFIFAVIAFVGWGGRISGAGEKPLFTLDEFFNSVSYPALQISPDGSAVVFVTERPDWDGNRYRHDLWLYRDGAPGNPVPLTQSGHDQSPQWSPDGHSIAFLSDRLFGDQASAVASGEKAEAANQVYVISADGGEAFPVTEGDEDVHAFAWTADSHEIVFAARQPLTKDEKESQKKEWNDVIRYREQERGDIIRRVDIAAIAAQRQGGIAPDISAATHDVTKIADKAGELAISPDGKRLAFFTNPRSERQDSMDGYGVYVMDLSGSEATAPRAITKSQVICDRVIWAGDSHHLFFGFESGGLDGPYQDAQPRFFWADTDNSTNGHAFAPVRWAAKFDGALLAEAVQADGQLLVAGRVGTEVQPYIAKDPDATLAKRAGWPGSYERFSAAAHSPRVAFIYSSLDHPTEIYLADSASEFEHARPISSFNHIFTERASPQGKPYRWTATDGSTVEGMLIYPPGKFEAKNLPTLLFIHGGPDDADGNRFAADWYQWEILAATNGWLVFQPNYCGSFGYGDAFALALIPHIVSRPGKEILEGVDALVKDGVADPAHLTIGGYSYGGYLTNWLITQTTRFKAAVTGAGAVEHVAEWGNDDASMDGAYFLGGLPWDDEANFNAEAAIWQFGKVTTPTHDVAGAEDIRVAVAENYLLERALHARGVPSSLLIFPGEGHSLEKNPWHGKIKVRDEIKWLEKYGR